MGREEEMGILIELVSVRAGASSKGWRTTESLRVGRRVCAGVGWESSGTWEHQPGFLHGHTVRNLPLHPGSRAGLSSCSSPGGLSSPPPPHPDRLPLPPSHGNHHPKKPSEKPWWVHGDRCGAWCGSCLLLSARPLVTSKPGSFTRSPAVFAC